jgi:hypothetical protein
MTGPDATSLLLPPDPTPTVPHAPDAWVERGRAIWQSAQRSSWDLGDWWNAGAPYGDRVRVARDLGYPDSSVRNAGRVSARFPEVYRHRYTLSYSHYAAVASMPDDVADFLLAHCVRAGRATKNLDALVRVTSADAFRAAMRTPYCFDMVPDVVHPEIDVERWEQTLTAARREHPKTLGALERDALPTPEYRPEVGAVGAAVEDLKIVMAGDAEPLTAVEVGMVRDAMEDLVAIIPEGTP